jgi:organic hydroperoxide reductase OsmC/OhrA
MAKEFAYDVGVVWTGNDGTGTSTRAFGRDNEITVTGKPTLPGSAPSEFGGDGVGWPPEELLVAAIAQCHMLTYLFVCSRNGIVVESYEDRASGTLLVEGAAGGHFTEVVLRPVITISAGDPDLAVSLHQSAHEGCYVGSSVNFPVRFEPTVSLIAPN